MTEEEKQQTPVDNPYIKLIKNTKGCNWEIKVYSNTTKEQMDNCKQLIDENQAYMENKYGSGLI